MTRVRDPLSPIFGIRSFASDQSLQVVHANAMRISAVDTYNDMEDLLIELVQPTLTAKETNDRRTPDSKRRTTPENSRHR